MMDEEQWETAVREVREEAGVHPRPICPIGKNAFEVKKKLVVVKYYLMECIDEIPRTDHREKGWFEFEKARDLLTNDENKKLLSAADQKRIAEE
jgi:8-oxo-dGTP pyrophosphatase MutT (NUDIX family)